MTTDDRTQKNDENRSVNCPEIIAFYNKYMGGVDLTDQLAGIYEFDIKSTKWWKKVFYKILMLTTTFSYIIYNEIRHKNKKIPFLVLLMVLAQSIIQHGKSKASVKRRSTYHM